MSERNSSRVDSRQLITEGGREGRTGRERHEWREREMDGERRRFGPNPISSRSIRVAVGSRCSLSGGGREGGREEEREIEGRMEGERY